MNEFTIHHNPDAGRFETEVDGHRCELNYRLSDNVVSMDRVFVPGPVEGRGIAGELTRHALDHAREQNWRVAARCPYVAAWIQRHPDYADLLAN
ncbi:MAG: GNAT family N-acetyltransferase [Wenzhouxiangellaceae bacterium]|nr:GNAT family N-acetyltransferase [Wenzhouxiangellaceae bacterium]